MFQRVLHEQWTSIIPVISFVLIFGVFVVATIRALRMKQGEREHLSSLPLEDSNVEH
jgi:uncharacterized membrane protein (DUF373 family)